MDYLKSLLVWITYHLISIVGSMTSQNLEDWEFSIAYLSDDPIQLFQPLTSRRRVRVEVKTSKRRVHLSLDLNPQQLPLTSLKSLQPNIRTLVIILEAEAMLVGSHQVVFEECFQNTYEGHMVSRLFDEIGH